MTSPATRSKTFLVFGGSGGTGKHFISIALKAGHTVRAVVRTPSKLSTLLSTLGVTEATQTKLEVIQGDVSHPESIDADSLVRGTDYIVVMLGDKVAQSTAHINESFVRRLVPSMRTHGVQRILYQAGGMSRPHGGSLTPTLWLLRNTLARFGGYEGQHRDNEAVIDYLATEASDLEWSVHRAGIYGDGESKGRLLRSAKEFSVAQHVDVARYNYETVMDDGAIRTCQFSVYAK